MKINKKSVIKTLEAEKERAKRGPVTLYLNEQLYNAFKKSCAEADLPASTVIEKLMEQWLKN